MVLGGQVCNCKPRLLCFCT